MNNLASRRKSSIACNKSRSRIIIPDYSSVAIDEVIVNRSRQLIDIGLLACMWETYKVNALYDFSYEKLKHYEENLAAQVMNDLLHIESDSPYRSQNFIIKMEYFPEMVYCERDYPPIKITIVAENDDGFEKQCFVGYLLSIEREKGCLELERELVEAIILPLLLVNYESNIFLNSIICFLKDNFSSVVTPLKFSSRDLIFMLFLFSSPEKDESTIATLIEYQGPSKDFSGIEYIIDPFSVSDIWKQVAAQCTEEVTESDTYEFLSVFEAHFFKMFSINLSHLDLKKIKTPISAVEADHSIQVFKSPKLFYVLRHITHLAQEYGYIYT